MWGVPQFSALGIVETLQYAVNRKRSSVKVRQFHWNAEELPHRRAAAAVWSSSAKEEGFTGS